MAEARQPAAADPVALLPAYLQARYRIHLDDGEHTLSPGRYAPVRTPAPGRLHAVLTACNPGSQPLDETENQTRQTQLIAVLAQLQHLWWPAGNAAVDGQWFEPACWLPDITPDLLDRLAAQFGQNASLVVNGDGMCQLRIHRADWHAHLDADTRLQWPT